MNGNRYFFFVAVVVIAVRRAQFYFSSAAEVEGARIYFSIALNSAIAGIIVLPSRAEV